MITVEMKEDRSFAKDTVVIGYIEENKAQQLKFNIPEELNSYNKKICFDADGEIFAKAFEDVVKNIITLTKDITKYKRLDLSIEFFKIENDDTTVVRSGILHLINVNTIICDDDIQPDDPNIAIIDSLIANVSSAVEQTNNLNVTIDDNVLTITDKEGNETSTNVKGTSVENLEVIDGDLVITLDD